MIVDYSLWRPRTQSELNGVNGAIRYIATDPAKAATAEELAQLHAWGIGTALVFEDAADRPTQGPDAGTADGQFAAHQLVTLGVPHGRPCYVACDFDIQDYAPESTSPYAKLGPVGAYLHSFLVELEHAGYQLGVYGGYWCVSRAMDAGLTGWAWQAFPWSPVDQGIPRQDHRIRLYQTSVQVLGGQADLNFAGTRDWGQFRCATEWVIGAGA